MLVNFLSLCSVSSMRSGSRHWTSLRCLRRRDSWEYGVSLKANPKLAAQPSPFACPTYRSIGSTPSAASAGQVIFGVAPLPASFCSPHFTPVDEVARAIPNLHPAGQQVSFGVCDNAISNRRETHLSPPTSGVFISLYSGHTVVKALMSKFGLIRRVWTPIKVGFPTCSTVNGADTSNDDEDEW